MTGELLLLAALLGQPAAVPAWAQAAPEFYGAVAGGDLTVTLTASTTDLPRDAEFTLTLTVRNAKNPAEVRRPPLAKLPAFADRFQIVDAQSPAPGPDVTFVYTARPKAVGAVEVPGLRFAYFNPARPDGKLPMKITPPIPLTVRPPAPPPAAVDPLPAADRLFALPAAGPGVRLVHPPVVLWATVPVLAGLLAVGWVVAWRWRNPDGARLAKLRRVRAVRRALDQLSAAERASDPAADAALAVRDYLIERYGAAVVGPVPAEAERALVEVGVPAGRAAEVAEFFRACDESRFAGGFVGRGESSNPYGSGLLGRSKPSPEPSGFPKPHPDLPDAARRLVLDWEGV